MRTAATILRIMRDRGTIMVLRSRLKVTGELTEIERLTVSCASRKGGCVQQESVLSGQKPEAL
jgi:hypothetical protein